MGRDLHIPTLQPGPGCAHKLHSLCTLFVHNRHRWSRISSPQKQYENRISSPYISPRSFAKNAFQSTIKQSGTQPGAKRAQKLEEADRNPTPTRRPPPPSSFPRGRNWTKIKGSKKKKSVWDSKMKTGSSD